MLFLDDGREQGLFAGVFTFADAGAGSLRQAIIDSAFVGQGEPWQAGPRKESPYYNERLAKQYTEYDVAKANE